MDNNKYQLAKIYKIIDNTNGNKYIGSTYEKTLAHRLAKHIGYYKNWLKGGNANYMTSFDILKNADYNIILIELYPCNSKDELLARERHHIDTVECVNKNKPGLLKELGQKLYSKEYRDTHLEYYKAKDKKRRETKCKCQCSGRYTNCHKAEHFRSQKHVNYIERHRLLANHNATMTELENLINETTNFINLAKKFITSLNLLI